ncbi:unnamed protein product [Camellia sinensis]
MVVCRMVVMLGVYPCAWVCLCVLCVCGYCVSACAVCVPEYGWCLCVNGVPVSMVVYGDVHVCCYGVLCECIYVCLWREPRGRGSSVRV